MTELLPLDGESLLAILEEAMKEAAGRPEDLLDLKRLREARGE